MSKELSPAYQHYPNDYLSDINPTMMSLEEEGMYRRLMDHCWKEIILPNNIDDLTTLCKGKQPTSRVLDCFVKVDSGYRHKRLDEEREKQARHKENSAKGGRASAHKRKKTNKKSVEQCTTVLLPSETQVKGKSSSSSSSSFTSSKIPPTPPKGNGYNRTDLFEKFWASYPRKESKKNALKAFNKIKPEDRTVAEMILWLNDARVSEQWQDKGKIPHPSTWLNQERWRDDPPPKPEVQNKQETIFDKMRRGEVG